MQVELIETIELTNSVWLTFWNAEAHKQICAEIKNSKTDYVIGEMYDIAVGNSSNEIEVIKPLSSLAELVIEEISVDKSMVNSSDLGEVVRIEGIADNVKSKGSI